MTTSKKTKASRLLLTKQLVRYTSLKTKQPEKLVADVINFTSKYTADTMKAGSLEGVSFPYFGKFVARLDYVQTIDHIRARPKSVTNEVI